jgi:DNA-binding CsgD family transcriptional regulator
MICTAASFPDLAAANRVRNGMIKRKFPSVQVYLCGKCDALHFRGSEPNLRIHREAGRVLRLCAMGFNAYTIAEMTGYTYRTVQQTQYDLRQWFGALNIPHLVSIAIAIGYLNPNEFVPPVLEECAT